MQMIRCAALKFTLSEARLTADRPAECHTLTVSVPDLTTPTQPGDPPAEVNVNLSPASERQSCPPEPSR
ncbi:hypothetical protein JZ751_022082 [Albula glossodonta]|uniref:Uncharacterized protein n=1 Tax=Albula glossodonta TaxID=121402 RepID=A0A8T2MYP9_9TELE|nr:hypothetical protein JZ751_022082 [Albula glossodonta]